MAQDPSTPESPSPAADAGAEALSRALAELGARAGEADVHADLGRERALMEVLGDPQDAAPVAHLAGTNGKTSTARMVDALVRAAGLTTGLYTSPHLHSPAERIAVNGTAISGERFAELYAEVAPYAALVDAAAGPLTWFEFVTGMAFAAFADAPVDAMVVEAGMGGSWDATNVVTPSVCTVTPIGIDHARYLGTTIAEVAAHKAGIITAAVPVVSAVQDPAAAEVLRARAAEVGATLRIADRDFRVVGSDVAVGGQLLDIEGVYGSYADIFLPLHGRHMAANAALAVATAEEFLGGRALDPELVVEGLGDVGSPGRLEVLRRSPTVVADGAHNPMGMRSLVASLPEAFPFGRVIAVVAVLADKDAGAMLAELREIADRIVVTSNSSPRAMPTAELAELARLHWDDEAVDVCPDIFEALDVAIELADADMASMAGVVVTGSLTTVADARMLLGRE